MKKITALNHFKKSVKLLHKKIFKINIYITL